MSPLLPFLNRHAGETAWLFGKGPSLANFDFQTAGPLRVAINDVARYVPDCRYCFANDGVGKWRDVYQPGQILFQPRRCLTEFDSTAPGALQCEVVTYDDTRNDIRLGLPRADIAELPTIRFGTLGSALQILHVMGVESIHMVGIDGGCSHAPGFEWRTRLRADHGQTYDRIKSSAIDTAAVLGIALHFHNSTDTMTTDGKIFVRMLRNCFANAQPYSEGEIASFSPKTARELITIRCAEPYTPPAKDATPPPVETTESKVMQAAESAVVKTAKGKARK